MNPRLTGTYLQEAVMDEAYEEFFNNLKEGEEALSFAEFVESLS